MKRSAKRLRSPVKMFGGKDWLPNKLPFELPPHEKYVEPFAGGAKMLFDKEPAPFEVLNDLDSGVVNFYRVLRDETLFDRFLRMVELTPYSREEQRHCRKSWQSYSDPVERAWSWFTAIRQSRNGFVTSNWSRENHRSSRGMAGAVSKWLSAIDRLPEIHERLRRVQIEHQDFRKVLSDYDDSGTFFYLDPPYVHSTRGSGRYRHEMSDGDHLELVDLLLDLKGMALLSGYPNEIYQFLEASGWGIYDIAWNCYAVHPSPNSAHRPGKRPKRTERLWMSPSLLKAVEKHGSQ